MAYEALARKYRPRTFAEVVGQKPIVRTLTNAIRGSRIHHAYVFSGVRGVGKTTIARIFAKALNCEKGPTPEPCLACSACTEIAAGQDLDVIEMDAASRTGVDDVRELIDTTRYAPARDRYKVFIIDEFHMLSRPAFNALLKTLEEPPPRVVFVMATTELHKVPSTVLSRTQQFDFRKVSLGEIVDLLEAVARKESIRAPRACLEMLARAADGSVRDAESLLDQAIASCGPDLEEDALRALLGLVPDETVEDFFAAAAGRDAGALVRLIDSAVSEGHDLRVFLAGLIEGGRRLLVLRTVASPSEILGLAPEHEARLTELSERFDTISLLRVMTALVGLEGPLKYSEQPRFVLEAAAIRIAAIAELAPIEDLIARLEAGDPAPGPRAPSPLQGRGASSSGPAPPRGPAPAEAGPGGSAGAGGKRSASPSPTPGSPSAPGRRKPARGGEDAGSGAVAVAGSETALATGSENTLAIGSETKRAAGLEIKHAAVSDDVRPLDRDPGARPGAGPDARAQEAAPPGGEDPGPAPDGDDARLRGDEERATLLELLHDRKVSLAALVEKAVSITVSVDRVTLVFDDTGSFARKSVEQAVNLATLRDVASAAFGRKIAIDVKRASREAAAPAPARDGSSTQVGQAARAAQAARGGQGRRGGADGPAGPIEDSGSGAEDRDAFPRSAAAASGPGQESGGPGIDDESAAGSISTEKAASAVGAGPAQPSEARRQRLLAEALEDPLVRKLIERFDGRVVEVKEVQ